MKEWKSTMIMQTLDLRMPFEDFRMKNNNRTIEKGKLNNEERWINKYRSSKERKQGNTKCI